MTNKFRELLSNISNTPRELNNNILLIDGLNTFLRSFTVINHINADGHHIGGLTGSLKSIGYAIRIINPTYVIIIFDGIGSASSRRNLFPDYKANRHKNRATNYDISTNKDEEDESIRSQISRLVQYLQCLPVSMISIDGTEADDIIGFLVNKFEQNSETSRITIMSADKDFLQLVTDKTQVYSPTKKKIYTPQAVLEEYEITSSNYIIQKILLGDKSDNIPGVSGLGPKKLIKLFPEVLNDKVYSVNELLQKSALKVADNKLYGDIINFKRQIEINNILMNLREITLSEENEELAKQMAMNRFKLQSHLFLQMYHRDNLGESIGNVPKWINENFSYLDLI